MSDTHAAAKRRAAIRGGTFGAKKVFERRDAPQPQIVGIPIVCCIFFVVYLRHAIFHGRALFFFFFFLQNQFLGEV